MMQSINGTTKLIALVSFGGFTECKSGLPVGFTRVGEYSDWIARNAGLFSVCR